LSSEQQKQVDSIWKSHEADRERLQKARMQGQAQDTALMREWQQLRKKHTEEYRRVLTEEQRKVFDGNLESMRRGYPGRGQGQGGPPPQQHQGPPN
jgi:hypothetical protein